MYGEATGFNLAGPSPEVKVICQELYRSCRQSLRSETRILSVFHDCPDPHSERDSNAQVFRRILSAATV